MKKTMRREWNSTLVISLESDKVRSSEHFSVLKRDTIKQILDRRGLIMIYKALDDLVPAHVSLFFIFCNNSTYELRSNERKLYVPKPENNFLKKERSCCLQQPK